MQAVASQSGLALVVNGLVACSVRGDHDQLRRLLFNLLDNAMKFTPPGGSIAVRAGCTGGVVRVTVADTGVGISAEHLTHVFDRFYRVDPARGAETAGAGLGLSICRAIVEAHGGSITIELDHHREPAQPGDTRDLFASHGRLSRPDHWPPTRAFDPRAPSSGPALRPRQTAQSTRPRRLATLPQSKFPEINPF
jgi:hypothetical protein